MINIKSICFFNHYIFENQKFDFTIDGIKPINNIIIAGENGSGKTKLLEEIYNLSNESFYPNHSIYSQKTHELIIDISTENYCNFDHEQERVKEAILIISKNDNGNISHKVIFKNGENEIKNVKKSGLLDKINVFKLMDYILMLI